MKVKIWEFIKNFIIFSFSALIIPMPWFLFSFINTGNPVYPFFSKNINLGTNFSIPNVFSLPGDFLNLFVFSSDPISPIYLITLPLILLIFLKVKKEMRIIFIYSFIALMLWYLTPKIGGGRFILPYLPIFSILSIYSIDFLKNKRLKLFMIYLVILVALSTIGYRFIANYRFIPVVFGKESKAEYLSRHLNFNFGDFYDTDGYFASHIRNTDKVLLYGFHNLYYVNFPFIDASWIKRGDVFNYLATQNTELPSKFKSSAIPIYYNPQTHVKLYAPKEGKWVY